MRRFLDKYTEAAEEYKAQGLKLARRSARELSMFDDAVKAIRRHGADKSSALVLEFEGKLKRTMREMDDREDAAPSDLDKVVRAARELAEDLRRQEQHLVEDFKDLYARFEEAYNGIKVARKKAAEVLVEELEDEYTEGVNKLLDDLLQQFAEEKLKADELATEVFVMLQSRDVAKAAVNNSHDNHLGQILSAEGDKSEALATEVRDILERYAEDEHQRNRQRMVEIRNFVQSVQRRVSEYIAREFPESD